jgi:hypothetical protein
MNREISSSIAERRGASLLQETSFRRNHTERERGGRRRVSQKIRTKERDERFEFAVIFFMTGKYDAVL